MLRLIATRAHSSWQLRQKLLRKGCPPDEADKAVARLYELGCLDDAAFGRALVTRRLAARGPMVIAAELAAAGISRDLAAQLLDEVGPEEELAAAVRLAERVPDLETTRLAKRLWQRGFSPGVVRAVAGRHERRFASNSGRD